MNTYNISEMSGENLTLKPVTELNRQEMGRFLPEVGDKVGPFVVTNRVCLPGYDQIDLFGQGRKPELPLPGLASIVDVTTSLYNGQSRTPVDYDIWKKVASVPSDDDNSDAPRKKIPGTIIKGMIIASTRCPAEYNGHIPLNDCVDVIEMRRGGPEGDYVISSAQEVQRFSKQDEDILGLGLAESHRTDRFVFQLHGVVPADLSETYFGISDIAVDMLSRLKEQRGVEKTFSRKYALVNIIFPAVPDFKLLSDAGFAPLPIFPQLNSEGNIIPYPQKRLDGDRSCYYSLYFAF